MSTVQEQKAIREKNNLRKNKVNKDAISKTSALIDCIILKKERKKVTT